MICVPHVRLYIGTIGALPFSNAVLKLFKSSITSDAAQGKKPTK